MLQGPVPWCGGFPGWKQWKGGQAFDEPSSIAQVSPTQLHPWRRQPLFIDKQVQMMMMPMEWKKERHNEMCDNGRRNKTTHRGLGGR